MAEGKNDSRPEPKLWEAAARTTEVLQTLQSRLKRESLVASAEEDLADLESQLKEYFAASTKERTRAVPPDLHELVVESVVDRVFRTWNSPHSGLADLKSEVIARLADRILAQMKDQK